MKIIVTGGTGRVGSAVLRHCIENKAVTNVYALTRRPLPTDITSHSKITNIVHKDFSSYPDTLLNHLTGAEACVWALGMPIGKGGGSYEKHHDPDVTFTLNAANAFVAKLQPQLGGRKFRFVYVSAWLAERDQDKSLWFGGVARRSKGEAEQGLFDLASRQPDAFELYAARMGLMVAKETWTPNLLLQPLYCIREDQLSAALVEIAVNGYAGNTVYAPDLYNLGTELVSKKSAE